MDKLRMHNIPQPKTELTEKLRDAFREDIPELSLLMDYSDIELRVIANMSDEEIAEFMKGPP